jgi:hypothetical protein
LVIWSSAIGTFAALAGTRSMTDDWIANERMKSFDHRSSDHRLKRRFPPPVPCIGL